eukprot:410354-Pyramimonas_sp.AAC.1
MLRQGGDHPGAGRARPQVSVGAHLSLLRRPRLGRARSARVGEAFPPAAHCGGDPHARGKAGHG